MATLRKTKKNARTKKPNKKKETLLEQFLAELGKEIDTTEAGVSSKITKGQALIKSMVNEALGGDQRMMSNVLKFIEKLDDLQASRKKVEPVEIKTGKQDWELMLHFYTRHKPCFELEAERLKKENPATFDLKWGHVALKDAPWYKWYKEEKSSSNAG